MTRDQDALLNRNGSRLVRRTQPALSPSGCLPVPACVWDHRRAGGVARPVGHSCPGHRGDPCCRRARAFAPCPGLARRRGRCRRVDPNGACIRPWTSRPSDSLRRPAFTSAMAVPDAAHTGHPGHMRKGPPVIGGPFRRYVRLRPTLPHRHQCSTIGAEGLSFRVRNGAGRFPFAMTAETLWRCQSSRPYLGNCTVDANKSLLCIKLSAY